MEKINGIPLKELAAAMTPEKAVQFRQAKIYHETFQEGAGNLNLMSSALEQDVARLNEKAKEAAQKS